MKTCLIDAKLAIALRDLAEALNFKGPTKNLGFRCPECKQELTIHNTGEPHLEHLPDHEPCVLSHGKKKLLRK